jgi:hypothetical protein
MHRRLTTEEWRKICQAVKAGTLAELIEQLMAKEYDRGAEDDADQ